MRPTFLRLALLLGALALAPAASADDDVDLPINGDFRGAPAGASPAPGWTLTADGGGARVLPTTDRDDFMLELRATAARPQSAVTELHPFAGNVVKLSLKASGTGRAAAKVEAFDAARAPLPDHPNMPIALGEVETKVKSSFTFPPAARFVRVKLTAEPGAVARFRDVDAEVSGRRAAAVVVPAPAPAVIPAPAPVPGLIQAPAPAPRPGEQAAPRMARGIDAANEPTALRAVLDDQYFDFASLGQSEHFAVTVAVGHDIDFDLGEPNGGGWAVVSGFDASVCRVKLEHDVDHGRRKAEIEMKALRPGATNVTFTGGGKQVTVHFTAQ